MSEMVAEMKGLTPPAGSGGARLLQEIRKREGGRRLTTPAALLPFFSNPSALRLIVHGREAALNPSGIGFPLNRPLVVRLGHMHVGR